MITIDKLRKSEIKTQIQKVIIPQLRLDAIISELAKTSRTKAVQLIDEKRVFINFEIETKYSKIIKEEDFITIRGKGRFKISKILGKTRKR